MRHYCRYYDPAAYEAQLALALDDLVGRIGLIALYLFIRHHQGRSVLSIDRKLIASVADYHAIEV